MAAERRYCFLGRERGVWVYGYEGAKRPTVVNGRLGGPCVMVSIRVYLLYTIFSFMLRLIAFAIFALSPR